jgi:capsid portal protein
MSDIAERVEGEVIQGGGAQIFTFGDPESVLDRRELCQYFEVWHNGRWYEPPLPMDRLALAFNMSPHHRSAVAMKVNMLLNQQVATRWLDSETFERFALDFVQMGNGYLEWVPNLAGRIARAAHSPARQTRRGVKPGVYLFINNYGIDIHEYQADSVFHLQQPDVGQEVYGLT